jgi:hypothetical protein
MEAFMYRFVAALLLAGSGTAFGQTPADLAHQVFPAGAKASPTDTAPVHGAAGAGAFSAADLARLTGFRNSASSNRPPHAGAAYVSGISGGDLARLRGVSPVEPVIGDGAPYRLASSPRD